MKTLIAQALVTQCFSIFFVSLSHIITLKRIFYPFFTPKDLLWKTNNSNYVTKRRQPPPSAVSDMTMATGANSNNKI